MRTSARKRTWAVLAGLIAVACPAVAAADDEQRHPDPFETWAAQAEQIHLDIMGEPAEARTILHLANDLRTGARTPGTYVASKRRSADHEDDVDPVVRLYRAFYLRTPDPAGLEFWVDRRARQGWRLVRTADHFAGASEFRTRYGSLNDLQFVWLVYVNVLGRPPDAAGLGFWGRQLEQRKRSRGGVMVGFSESSEYVRKQAAAVDVSVIRARMLRERTTPAQFESDVAELEAGLDLAAYADRIFRSDAYAIRMRAPITISTTALPEAVEGEPYDATLRARGGTSARTWSTTGLPDGLEVDASTGRISGTPELRGASQLSITVTSTSGTSDTATVTVVVGPAMVPLRWKQLSAGFAHTCGILTDGRTACWGDNRQFELGTQPTTQSRIPALIPDVPAASSVATGDRFTCAQWEDRTARCWGANWFGQLARDQHPSPDLVDLEGIAEIHAGGLGACAVLDDRRSVCWGGVVPNSIYQPDGLQDTTGWEGIEDLDVGDVHACAILSGNVASCWGGNPNGELGDGTTEHRWQPITVPVGEAIDVATGWQHTCVVRTDGTVACWGSNHVGQLGRAGGGSLSPVDVSGIDDAVAIEAGIAHTCVLRTGGTISCWGWRAPGLPGGGTLEPFEVAGISGAKSITLGWAHTCAVLADDTASCWGENEFGQLGTGLAESSPVPVPVASVEAPVPTPSA